MYTMLMAGTAAPLALDSHKLLWHLDRLRDWQAGRRVAPVHIDMGLTKGCNLRCRYCYGKVQKLDGSSIPRGPLLTFLADAARAGVRSVAFIGDGEPLLNPAVYDAVDAGSAAGLDLAVGTNGLLLDLAQLDRFLPPLAYLRFNISAAGEEAYGRIHQAPPGSFARACAVIRACVEHKRRHALPVTIGLQMVLVPECLDQAVPLARLGRELGADYFVIKHCSDSEDGELGIPLAEYPSYEPVLREAEQQTAPDYRVIVKWRKILACGRKQYDRCLAVPFLLQISGNGDVKPCGFLFPKEGYLMGNIVRTPFRDILAGEAYWIVVRELAERFDVHTQCGTGCRHDYLNTFLWELSFRRPQHHNFV